MRIILASKSPRRKELLNQIGVECECIVSQKKEEIFSDKCEEVVVSLAAQKADEVDKIIPTGEDYIIIAADTIVSINNKILGKPHNEKEAYQMLEGLQGNKHQVYTGVKVIFATGKIKEALHFYECTNVYVRKMEQDDILAYIKTGEPMDKAGSYGIQGRFAPYVEKIEGDYNNVVGLPLSRLFYEIKDKLHINLVTKKREPICEVKACIFDLDGTILDTVLSIGTTANKVLKEFGLLQMPIENYKHYAGDGQIELIKRALIDAGDQSLEFLDDALKRYISLFEEGCTYKVHPYEGILELFKNLKQLGIKIIVFSNKEHNNVVHILNQIFGDNYFDMILGQRPDHKKKPSGEGIDLILQEIKLLPKQCVYIGDTATDMLTGKGYGLYTIGVTWGFRDRGELINNNADCVVDKPHEIYQLISKIVKKEAYK